MPLLPEEVADKTFSRRWRGYDRREVDGFLHHVAADYTAAIHQIGTAAAQRPQPRPYEGLGMEVAAIAQAARQAAEDIRREAERDAERSRSDTETLRQAAREDAEQARRSMDEAQRLRAELDRREQRLAVLEGRILERVRAIEQHAEEVRARAALLDEVSRLESVAKTLRAEVESGIDWPIGEPQWPASDGRTSADPDTP